MAAKVFMPDIPLLWSENYIKQLFGNFGPINNVQIISKYQYITVISYAIIEFKYVKDACVAICKVNGSNSSIKLFWAFPLPSIITQGKEIQLIVSFKSKKALELSAKDMTLYLRNWLDNFGLVKSVCIQKLEKNAKLQLNGYAFACYAQNWSGITSAINASLHSKNIKHAGIRIDAKFAIEFIKILKQYDLLVTDKSLDDSK